MKVRHGTFIYQLTPGDIITFVYRDIAGEFRGPWANESDLHQALQWMVRGKSCTFGRTALRLRRFPCESYTFGGLPDKAYALHDAPSPKPHNKIKSLFKTPLIQSSEDDG